MLPTSSSTPPTETSAKTTAAGTSTSAAELSPPPLTPQRTDRITCVDCLKALPLTAFSKYKLAQRVCSDCLRKAAAKKLMEQISKRRGDPSITGRKVPELQSPHITEFTDVLVRKMGGLERLVDQQIAQLRRAEADAPGSKRVLEAYRQITNLVKESTIHRQSAPDVTSLSDAELELERVQIILQLIAEDSTGETLKSVRQLLGVDAAELLDGQDQTITATPSGETAAS